MRARIPTWAAAPTALPARARKTLFLARVCLGLDCHEFSTAPSHTRSTLTAQDKIFSTRFHYKIKRKQGKFEKCKVRLVVQGQHMHRKDEQGRGDFEDAFSPVPHASGFRMILALATQNNMHCDHVDISQAFVQGDLLPGDGYNGKVYISAPPGMMRTPIMSISCSDLFTVCQVPLELGITL